MRSQITLAVIVCMGCLAGCTASPVRLPVPTFTSATTPPPLRTVTQPASPTPTSTPTPSPTSTLRPLTLVFYGDSVLKVGDVSRQGEVGFSIVDDLRTDLLPADQIIISNHGGRNARWGSENLDKNVLIDTPDLVTLWWGMNDLGGCPGIFDRETNKLQQYKLDAMVKLHIFYMKQQIEALLAKKIGVIVITPMPILGTLPWSHFSPDNELVWENDFRCNFNAGLEQLVIAQRRMVESYAARQMPVFMVDAWQIYKDHPNTDKMYMDIVHPGSHGASLIAEQWLQVFQNMEK
jgi:hypothetical protein